MAHINTHTPAQNAFFAPFSQFISALLDGMERVANANPKLREVEYLSSLSDKELARRGLQRDAIVQHVFRNFL